MFEGPDPNCGTQNTRTTVSPWKWVPTMGAPCDCSTSGSLESMIDPSDHTNAAAVTREAPSPPDSRSHRAKEKPKSLKDLLARHNQAPGNQYADDFIDSEPPTTEEMKDMLEEAFLDLKVLRPPSAKSINPSEASHLHDSDDFNNDFKSDDVSVDFSEVEWRAKSKNDAVKSETSFSKKKGPMQTEEAPSGAVPSSTAESHSQKETKSKVSKDPDKKRKMLKKRLSAEDLGLSEDEFKDPARLQEALRRWAKDHRTGDQVDAPTVKPSSKIRVSSKKPLSLPDKSDGEGRSRSSQSVVSESARRRSQSRGRPRSSDGETGTRKPLVLPGDNVDNGQDRMSSSQSVATEASSASAMRRRSQSRGRPRLNAARSKSRVRAPIPSTNDDDKSLASRNRSQSRVRKKEKDVDPPADEDGSTIADAKAITRSRSIGPSDAVDTAGTRRPLTRSRSSAGRQLKSSSASCDHRTNEWSDDKDDEDAEDSAIQERGVRPQSSSSSNEGAPSVRGRSCGRHTSVTMKREKSQGRLKLSSEKDGERSQRSRSVKPARDAHRSKSRARKVVSDDGDVNEDEGGTRTAPEEIEKESDHGSISRGRSKDVRNAAKSDTRSGPEEIEKESDHSSITRGRSKDVRNAAKNDNRSGPEEIEKESDHGSISRGRSKDLRNVAKATAVRDPSVEPSLVQTVSTNDPDATPSPSKRKTGIGSRIHALRSAFLGGNRADVEKSPTKEAKHPGEVSPGAASIKSFPALQRNESGSSTSSLPRNGGVASVEKLLSKRPVKRNASGDTAEWSEIDFSALQNGAQPGAAVVRRTSLLGGMDTGPLVSDDESDDASEPKEVPHKKVPVDLGPRKIDRRPSFFSKEKDNDNTLSESAKKVGSLRNSERPKWPPAK